MVGNVGVFAGTVIPTIGWGTILLSSFAVPRDYGLNQTIGPPTTIVGCSIAGFLGFGMAKNHDRTAR